MILGDLELLFRRSLTLDILLMSSVHHSWDFGIDVRCDGSPHHLDCGIGFENRSVDFYAGCESGVGEIVIVRADRCQFEGRRKWS